MTAYAHTIAIITPKAVERPRAVIAFELLLDWVAAVADTIRRRRAAHDEQRDVRRDVAAARRAAYTMMRVDPRVGAELLIAADRHEALHLRQG